MCQTLMIIAVTPSIRCSLVRHGCDGVGRIEETKATSQVLQKATLGNQLQYSTGHAMLSGGGKEIVRIG